MKKRFIVGKHNVLHFLLLYLGCVMIVISILGGYLYYYLYKAVYLDFKEENSRFLENIVSRHESDMQIIDNIVTQMRLDESIPKFHLVGNLDKSMELKNHLRGYTAVSQFFEQIFYMWQKDEYIYNYMSSFKRTFLLNERFGLEHYSNEELEDMLMEQTMELRIWPEQIVTGSLINSYLVKSREYTIMFRAVPPDLDETLMFCIPSSYYDEILASKPESLRKVFLCYEGKVIVCRGSLEISEKDLVELSEGKEGTYRVSLEDEEYILSLKKGESGILYSSLQSKEVFVEQFRIERTIVSLLVLICIVSGMAVVILMSIGLVKKVKRMSQLLDEDSFYDLSNIENGIQTLITERQKSEDERIAYKKTRFIISFIRGDYADRRDVLEQAELAQLQLLYEKYVIVLLHNNEPINENKTHMLMLQAISRKKQVEGYGARLLNSDQSLFVLFGNSHEILWEIIEELLDILKQNSDDFIIAISNFHDDFMEGAKAYLEADVAFNSRVLFVNSKVICFSELEQKEYVDPISDIALRQLSLSIRMKDKVAMEKAVKYICDEMKEEAISLYSFRVFYNNMIHVLLSEWKGNKKGIEKIFNVFTVSQCINKNDFYELICDMCRMIIDNTNGKVVDESKLVQDAIFYMQENFTDCALNMNGVVEKLGVSTTRLSMEFKKKMNMRPLDYLTILRMEKAKALLRETDMSVSEIGRAVGYEDVHVFIRWFKQYAGTTPGKYRL